MDAINKELDDVSRLISNDALPNTVNVKISSLQTILGLTGSSEGCVIVAQHTQLLSSIVRNMSHEVVDICTAVCSILVNLSAEEEPASHVVSVAPDGLDFIEALIEQIKNKNSCIADYCVTVLSNLAHHPRTLEPLIDRINPLEKVLAELIEVFNCVSYNENGCNLNGLASFFSNLTQSIRARRLFLCKTNKFLQKLLPFTDFPESYVRRRGVLGTIMNCCFDISEHSWLLSDDVDVLPKLLLPLAGSEEFDEEDNNKLPIELQYLPESKTRDDDAVVRKTALDALYLLCANRTTREILRECNTYVILRELHKWETDRNILLVCENVVNVLIRTEDEIGVDQVKELDVPEDLKEKFDNMDADFLEGR